VRDLLSVRRQGDTVRARIGDPGGGRLADSDLYRRAMSGAPRNPLAAVYVDLTRTAVAGNPVARPVKAVALTLSRDGDHLAGLLHVVVD
jgi:hypothetical protein